MDSRDIRQPTEQSAIRLSKLHIANVINHSLWLRSDEHRHLTGLAPYPDTYRLMLTEIARKLDADEPLVAGERWVCVSLAQENGRPELQEVILHAW